MWGEVEKMMNDNEQRIKDKVEFFMEHGIKVHVKLKDKTFLNGVIIKKLRENVYWMEEVELHEVFLFLRDIYDIDKYEEVGE